MILQHKNAVIYGAGGSLGGAIAQALAKAGASVFLTARRLNAIEELAKNIIASGGRAEVDEVDTFDEKAVSAHLEKIINAAGTLDISFNAAGADVVQNIPLVEISTDDFMSPSTFMLQSRFVTAIAAAKIMMKQRSGTILSLTATPGGIGYPLTGGFAPACAAIETFAKNLAAELGIYGIRVVNIRSAGSPDSKVFMDAAAQQPAVMETVFRKMKDDTMLKELPLMSDIANTAVFLVSDLAGKITGVTIDVTSGTTAGLNYRMASL
jgi:3-oxoacyl-[acyl-carrier protein] reductase